MQSRPSIGKTMRATILALLLTLILIGCGSQPPKPITITMSTGTVGNEFEVLKKQVSQFEAEHPYIQVQLFDPPESTNDRYTAYTDGFKRQDSTIDIYMIDIIWQPEFGAAGWTLPLNDYVSKNKINMTDLLPGPVQGNTWNGRLVSMPWFTDAGLLFYRKDLLIKYRFDVPQTWADLREIAETIVTAEKERSPHMVGFVFQGRAYEGLVTNYLEFVWANGADVLNPTGDQVVLDSPEAIEALETFIELRHHASPGVTSFQEADALNYFQSGNAVFMRNWPFAWAVLNDHDPAATAKVGIAPLPHGPQGTTGAPSALGGWQLAINAHSQHPDEAFEVIAFLTSTEQQNYKAIHAGQAPTRLASYQDPDVLAANPHFAELFEVLVKAKPRPLHPRYQDISAIIQREVHLALMGQQDARTATAAMATAIQRILDSSPEEASP